MVRLHKPIYTQTIIASAHVLSDKCKRKQRSFSLQSQLESKLKVEVQMDIYINDAFSKKVSLVKMVTYVFMLSQLKYSSHQKICEVNETRY